MTSDEIAWIDRHLQIWRQGDVVPTNTLPAVHLAHMAWPGTPASEELAALQFAEKIEPDLAAVMIEAHGFMVVSQTCDIVRACVDRPYLEVCPLLPIGPSRMDQVRLGRVSRYAWVTGLGGRDLAADLELVTTIEKATLVRYNAERTPGVATEAEARSLGEALGRKRARAAFPDDFTRLVAPLQRRVVERHGKDSSEGRFLRGLREIRVAAKPDWQAPKIEIDMLFVFETSAGTPDDADVQVEALVARITPDGRYVSVAARSVGLDSLSAAAYLISDRLDLDHLSRAVA